MRLFFILTTVLLLTSCLPFRAILLGAPDAKDMKRIHSESIEASRSPFEFVTEQNASTANLYINDWTKDIPFFMSLKDFVPTHKLRSFLLIQDDTIRFEYYGENTTAEDLHPSYSIAKSFTSALVGIAIDEGLIKSEQDLVIDYLPELKTVAPEFEKLKIVHLLNHTSGIKYSLPLDATIYYGNNTHKAFGHIQFEHQPGTF